MMESSRNRRRLRGTDPEFLATQAEVPPRNVLLGCYRTIKSSGRKYLRVFCFIRSVLSLCSFSVSVSLPVLRAVVL